MADAGDQAGRPDEGRPRRRIDRVSAVDYLDGVEQRPPAELRVMRDDCREEEGRMSYLRRLLQGRLDIVRAEQERRAAGSEEDLVDVLPRILADRSRGETNPAHTHNSPVHDYPEVGGRGEESLIRDASITRVGEVDDDELVALHDRLQAEERRVSGIRRTVLDHLDRLQAELVARYRDGSADLSEVVADLSPRGGSPGSAPPAGGGQGAS